MIHAKKKDHAMNPPAVSVAFSGEDNYPRPHSPNGLPDIRDSDDPADEKIRLMQDVKRLEWCLPSKSYNCGLALEGDVHSTT